MTLWDMYEEFIKSDAYTKYAPQTQRQYNYLLGNALDEYMEGASIGSMSYADIDKDTAEKLYTHISTRGTTAANQFRVAFNAMCKALGVASPIQNIKRMSAGKQTITSEHLRKLLEAAYSEFKWRNVGLLLQLTYEQGQPINKLTHCTWDDVDLDNETITVDGITTSLSADMVEMLTQQKKDFGFQEYVAPSPHPTREGYPPYGMSQLSRTLKKVRAKVGLSNDINVAEIRRLGLAAMLKDGMDEKSVKNIMHEFRPENMNNFYRQFDKIRRDG